MKRDKCHGDGETDCRAELVFVNGGCSDPAEEEASPPALEANGGLNTQGQSPLTVLAAWAGLWISTADLLGVVLGAVEIIALGAGIGRASLRWLSSL